MKAARTLSQRLADSREYDSVRIAIPDIEGQDWNDVIMSHRWKERSTILVHHEGRSRNPRGTSKREDILDSMINLKNSDPKPGEEVNKDESVFDLKYTKHRDFLVKTPRHWC